MIPAEPSHTAHRVALRRAAHQLLDRPRVLDDPIALAIIRPEHAEALRTEPGSHTSQPLSAAAAKRPTITVGVSRITCAPPNSSLGSWSVT